MPLSALPLSALSAPEQDRLTECESRIERGIAVFLDVGNALLEIRDSRLYRQQFPTFEAYCRERWGMSRFYAHRLIDAAEVGNNLLPIGNIPQTESQARPLTRLEPEVQVDVWREVIAETPHEQITAKIVDEKARAAEPLNDTVREIKAEIAADPAPSFFPASPARPDIAQAAQSVQRGDLSLVAAARNVRLAAESTPLPPPPVQPLHDLEGIDPDRYAQATRLQGALRRLAEFCRTHRPDAIASAFKAHEKPELRLWVAEAEAWTRQLIDHL